MGMSFREKSARVTFALLLAFGVCFLEVAKRLIVPQAPRDERERVIARRATARAYDYYRYGV